MNIREIGWSKRWVINMKYSPLWLVGNIYIKIEGGKFLCGGEFQVIWGDSFEEIKCRKERNKILLWLCANLPFNWKLISAYFVQHIYGGISQPIHFVTLLFHLILAGTQLLLPINHNSHLYHNNSHAFILISVLFLEAYKILITYLPLL